MGQFQAGKTDREAAVDYLFDMIDQLAKLAREIGDLPVAIHLEAIIAVQRATGRDQLV